LIKRSFNYLAAFVMCGPVSETKGHSNEMNDFQLRGKGDLQEIKIVSFSNKIVSFSIKIAMHWPH